jgi:hypothetical protein
MRLRHTLLASAVEFRGYEDIRFVHTPPATLDQAAEAAAAALELRWDTPRDSVLDTYLNGPRTLSDDKLAKLVISSPQARVDPTSDEMVEFDYWLFATHFLGDGMALHTFSNVFFQLLNGGLEEMRAEGTLQSDAEGNVVRHKCSSSASLG